MLTRSDKTAIVIFSQLEERSTDDVILWLQHKKKQFIRLNTEDSFHGLKIIDDEIKLIYKKHCIDFNNITSYWYRRPGGTHYKHTNINSELDLSYAEYFQKYEWPQIFQQLSFRLRTIKGINKLGDFMHYKLYYLNLAKSCKIEIPKWAILDNIADLSKFFECNGDLISKTMNIPFWSFQYENETNHISYGTQFLTSKDINAIKNEFGDERFYPTFVQKYIPKKYEIRTFFFKGKFYSMAIFSQQSEKTKIDYRNYDREHPNRLVPYQLPLELEAKLQAFMKAANIDCCSIDFIVGEDLEHYFLEINPIGQFKWLSKNCNYQLEKKISSYLYE